MNINFQNPRLRHSFSPTCLADLFYPQVRHSTKNPFWKAWGIKSSFPKTKLVYGQPYFLIAASGIRRPDQWQ